mgnify:CR=1 FL=1
MIFLAITFTNWIGYIASLALIISFTMKNVKTLRIINSFGCALFIYYGILLGNDLPIIITNGFIISSNLYYLLVKKD